MAPRKASDAAPAEPSRRSGRLASQPAPPPVEAKPAPPPVEAKSAPPPVEAKPAKAPRATKKRTAEGEDGAPSASKKAKAEKAKGDEPEAEPQPALEAIDIGGTLPTLTLKNEKGEDLEIANLAAEKGVILFLVPKAATPGCTTQACGFRDRYPDFSSRNFDVYCLSADAPTSQAKWQASKELPYPLISDPKRVLITALGAGEGGKTKRSHFIFEKGGKLIEKKLPVSAKESPQIALDFINSLQTPSEKPE